jgi:peptidoglycan/LPS O-acetylase OafA/YrhL
MHTPVRITQLDGLRGLAMLMVMTHHYMGDLGMTRQSSALLLALRAVLHSSWIAGDMLFVLSGFLITSIVIRHGHISGFSRVFYLRRGTRTVVPYYLFLLICFAATFFFEHGDDTPWFFFLTHLQALALSLSLTLPHMVVLWTLSWEEWFYVVLPFFFRSGGRQTLLGVSLMGLVLAPTLRFLHSIFFPISWEYAFVLRPDGLFWGMLLALAASDPQWVQKIRRYLAVQKIFALIGFASLCWISYGWWHHPPFSAAGMNILFCFIPFTSFHILTTVLLGGESLAFNRLLVTKGLQYIGRISFGVYLYHELFRLIVLKYLGFDSVLAIGMAVLASFSLAIVSWHCLEAPMIRFGHRFQYGATTADILRALMESVFPRKNRKIVLESR